jgi:hypothetical protein
MVQENNGARPILWKQGEHVVVIGRTGSGKTYLISKLIQLRQYVVFFRTKPDKNKFPDLFHTRTADAMRHFNGMRLLLEPDYKRQAVEGYRMLDNAWQDGSWCVVIDELWYAEEQLGLRDYVNRMLTQGRSKDISAVLGVQRPVDISRFALSETKHLFIFQTEGRDLKFTLRDSTTDRIVPAVQSLQRYEFIYYNRETGQIAKGNANRLGQVFTSTYRGQTIDDDRPIRHDQRKGAARRL